ncbi:urease accessory protein UreE [Flavobacterium agricola]|uniref:Urease accessory protein UreE n=1 Tax=Flavobacterium agricola TaxID=2870839 RepID=A0ABY6M173_9FLAO|nr:urease accessory protein UreE [Flavobacterium agricola]UYW02300.1 urease accessory protein UreE [Flavobacterium agricola]
MLVTQAIRNAQPEQIKQAIDFLFIEWYQTSKRIQRLTTQNGVEVAIRFLGPGQDLKDGDILYEDAHTVIMVSLLPCEAIVLHHSKLTTTALLAYEIGNKHVPLYVDDTGLLLPYEGTMFEWLQNNSYQPEVMQKKLSFALNANVDFYQHKKFTFTPPKGGLSLKL